MGLAKSHQNQTKEWHFKRGDVISWKLRIKGNQRVKKIDECSAVPFDYGLKANKIQNQIFCNVISDKYDLPPV